MPRVYLAKQHQSRSRSSWATICIALFVTVAMLLHSVYMASDLLPSRSKTPVHLQVHGPKSDRSGDRSMILPPHIPKLGQLAATPKRVHSLPLLKLDNTPSFQKRTVFLTPRKLYRNKRRSQPKRRKRGRVYQDSQSVREAMILKAAKQACGDLCDFKKGDEVQGLNSTYRHVSISKKQCRAMYNSGYSFLSILRTRALRWIPPVLESEFTQNGRVQLQRKYASEAPSKRDGGTRVWTRSTIAKYSKQVELGTLKGAHGVRATQDLYRLLKILDVKGSRILVLGARQPWVEVVALAAGAKSTVTVARGRVLCTDKRIKVYTPERFASLATKGKIQPFDAIVTYGQLQRAGLGRFGDALSPIGDVLSLAMAWCVAKKEARLVLQVPRARKDKLVFNSGRIYGPYMLKFLTTNWIKLVEDEEGQLWNSNQPVYGEHARALVYMRVS